MSWLQWNNVIYLHFSHHPHFMPVSIKGASPLPHVDDVDIEVIQKLSMKRN